VGNLRRHLAKVLLRQRQHFRVSPGMPEDSEHAPLRAVPPEPLPAHPAFPAGEVDLPDDALADPPRTRRPLDDPDELVPRNPGEPVIPALQLQVGIADPRSDDPHQRKTGSDPRSRGLSNAGFPVLEDQRQHGAMLSGAYFWNA